MLIDRKLDGTYIEKATGEEFECRQVTTRQVRKDNTVKYEITNKLWFDSDELINDKQNLHIGDWICVSHELGDSVGYKISEFEDIMTKEL